MAHNRLLGFRVVRSTRPVQYIGTEFVPQRESRTPREPEHVRHFPNYPGQFYLSFVGKYFFRHPELRHLRVEQYARYFAVAGDQEAGEGPTTEDTVHEDDDATTQVRDRIPSPSNDGLRRIVSSCKTMMIMEATFVTTMRPLLKHVIRS